MVDKICFRIIYKLTTNSGCLKLLFNVSIKLSALGWFLKAFLLLHCVPYANPHKTFYNNKILQNGTKARTKL